MDLTQIVTLRVVLAVASLFGPGLAASGNYVEGSRTDVVDDGITYVFVHGWHVSELREMTVDFVRQNPVAGQFIANLELTELEEEFFQLAFTTKILLFAVID